MAPRKKVLMAASGDLRQSANEVCWPAQEAMEKQVTKALAALDVDVERAHPYDPKLKHGFIASQKEGIDVFSHARFQPAPHRGRGRLAILAPCAAGPDHPSGPILTVANWSGSGRASSACSISTAR